MMKLNRMMLLAGLVAALVSAGCRTTEQTTSNGARLYDGFGNYTRTVSTNSKEAQLWFNQGMQLLYGFNHDEAIRSFEQVTIEDPNCAMAYWGIAYASGLHINNPMMSENQNKQAWEATQKAMEHIGHASPVERDLIVAVSKRYAMPAPADRKSLDVAYAAAMDEVWKKYPNDPDVGALYAESMMNLQPWDLWTHDGQPKGRTLEIVSVLEDVIAMRPDHPGANHFYIHAVEASTDPERAVPSADRLTTLVPGSGHLVHMPAHIYARVGRFDKSSDSNAKAIEVDRAYFKLAPPPEFYSMYFVHNLHFLAWSAMMEGRYAVASRAANDLHKEVPEAFLREWTYLADGFMPVTYHVMIRFGKWDEILNQPKPPEYRLVSVAMWHYARGVALSATGRTSGARQEMEAFAATAKAIPADWQVGQNKAAPVMAVAQKMLDGELAYREGRLDDAFASLHEGVALEEALVYDEPPGWMQPVRHALGALLMGAGRPAEAEVVYREDLAKYPGNGWAILGLQKALIAQGKTDEAAKYGKELAVVWTRADVKPTSSCYCEPGKLARAK